MNKKHDFLLYSFLLLIIIGFILYIFKIPGNVLSMTIGLLSTDILLIIFSIKKIIRKEASFLSLFSNILLILVSIVIFIKYMYWSFFDYYSIVVVISFIIFGIFLKILKLKKNTSFNKIIDLKTSIVFYLFFILLIPTFFHYYMGPNMVFPPSIYIKMHNREPIAYPDIHYKITNPNAKKYKQYADDFLNKGQLNEAFEYYYKAIENEPNNAYLHFELSNCYSLNYESDKQYDELLNVIKLDPKFAIAYSNLGLNQISNGNIEGAIDTYDAGLYVDSLSLIGCVLYFNKAMALNAKNEHNECNKIIYIIKRLLKKNKEYQNYLHSYYKEYYPNGKLKIEVEIIKGLQNGTLKEYYNNGQLKRLQEWKMGEPLGEHKIFLPSGQLVFHERTKYYESEWGIEKGFFDYYKDTTIDFKATDRVIINDLKQLNDSIKIVPSNRKLKFGISNIVSFKIPNIDITNLTFTFRNGKGLRWNGHKCEITPISLDKNVLLFLTAQVNDTIIYFDPIEFKVEK